MAARCPTCDIVLTTEEAARGYCPVCQKSALTPTAPSAPRAWCGQCNAVLGSAEMEAGRCSACFTAIAPEMRYLFALASQITTTGTVQHDQLPPLPPPPAPVSRGRKALVVSMLLVGLGSFCVPGGLIWSLMIGFTKGDSLCASPCCLEKTDQMLEFGRPPIGNFGAGHVEQRIGFCRRHVANAPKNISIRRGKSFSGLLAVVFLGGPPVFLLFYFGMWRDAMMGLPQALLRFFGMTLAAVFLINGLSALYWVCLEWMIRTSGW